MAYYSGVQGDITELLKSTVRIGSDRLSSFTPAELENFQRRADTLINLKLSGSFYTPLVMISVDGLSKYPDPLPLLAQYLTCALLLRSAYLHEPNGDIQAAIKTIEDETDGIFSMIINGAAVGASPLRGQRLMGRNRFQNPRIAPRENPKDARGV